MAEERGKLKSLLISKERVCSMTHHNELNQPGMLSDGCSQAGFSVEDGNQ